MTKNSAFKFLRFILLELKPKINFTSPFTHKLQINKSRSSKESGFLIELKDESNDPTLIYLKKKNLKFYKIDTNFRDIVLKGKITSETSFRSMYGVKNSASGLAGSTGLT